MRLDPSSLHRLVSLVFATGFVATALVPGFAQAQYLDTSRPVMGMSGANPNGIAMEVAVSPDGRYLAFCSAASNLVANDTNNKVDVFWYDRELNDLRRISFGYDGSEANGASMHPSVSTDGRYVAFASYADNLVANDTNFAADVFVYDSVLDSVILISQDDLGTQGDGHSYGCSITPDGTRVVFQSYATNLVANDTNNTCDIFVANNSIPPGIVRVSMTSDGVEANAISTNGSISDDGRFVAFQSLASNLELNDSNNNYDVFVYDLELLVVVRASVQSDGSPANGACVEPRISGDGSCVVFRSSATNLDVADANGFDDIYLRNLGTLETIRISRSTDSMPANSTCRAPMISTDARYVSYLSSASSLVPFDTNLVTDLFLFDRTNHTTQRINLSSAHEQANQAVSAYFMSADAGTFGYVTPASNLAIDDTNGIADMYLTVRTMDPDSDYYYSIDPRTFRGMVVDTSKPLGDRFSAAGAFAFNAYTPDAKFNPLTDNVVVRIGEETSPFEFAIAANDGGWKSLPNQKYIWRSGADASAKCVLTIDMKNRKFSVQMSRFDFEDGQGANPVRFSLGLGEDWLGFSAVWSEKSTPSTSTLKYHNHFE